jgi:hypothetical protein
MNISKRIVHNVAADTGYHRFGSEEGAISHCTPEEEETCIGEGIQEFWPSRMEELDMVR